MSPLAEYCKILWKDTTAIMNLYAPLRLHPMTRSAINNIVMKHKRNLLTTTQPQRPAAGNVANTEVAELSKENPMLQAQIESENQAAMEEEDEESIYYYGVLLMDSTVITIFKSNQDI